MTNRKKEHQLEDLSRLKYGLTLPAAWVYRDKPNDYGIDGEVEIFDSNGKPTGLVFWVQLKATESKSQSVIRGVSLKLDTIRYYKNLDIPVLLARYSSNTDTFYIKWATTIDLYYAKEGAKTIRVNFDDSDLLSVESADYIETRLRKIRAAKSGAITFPLKFSLSFGDRAICGITPALVMAKIRADLSKYRNVLELTATSDDQWWDIYLNEEILRIDLLGLAGCTFHGVQRMEKDTFVSEILKDVALGMSMSLAQLGFCDKAAVIFFADGVSDRIAHRPELMEIMVPHLLTTAYFQEALDFVSRISDSADSNLLEGITSMYLLLIRDRSNQDKLDAIEKFLIRNSLRYVNDEPLQYAVSQYNLGNFYGSIRQSRKAIICYLAARKYDPTYANRDYFHSELGGALFEVGKHRFSARSYKRAIDLEGPNDVRPLYADALLFSGEYQKALDVLRNYLSDTCGPPAKWILKEICLDGMIETIGLKQQVRKIDAATLLSDVCNMDAKTAEAQLTSALELDLLCGLAWFNMGDVNLLTKDIPAASFCFTVCSLVQPWDTEAWVKACMCSFNTEVSIEIFVLIIRAAYSISSEHFVQELLAALEDQAFEGTSEIASLIEQIVSTEPSREIRTEIRFPDQDGNFVNVLDPKNRNTFLRED